MIKNQQIPELEKGWLISQINAIKLESLTWPNWMILESKIKEIKKCTNS
jgi:hypothetical protein